MNTVDKVIQCFEQRARIVAQHGHDAFEKELAHWSEKLDRDFKSLRIEEQKQRNANCGWSAPVYRTAYEIVRGEG